MTKAQLNSGVTAKPITLDAVTVILAERIMGWAAAPDRFLMNGRRWIPRWRFQPFTNLEHAFRLLDHANCTYTLTADTTGNFTANVRVGDRDGRSSGAAKAACITVAIALAVGIDVPSQPESYDLRSPKTAMERRES